MMRKKKKINAAEPEKARNKTYEQAYTNFMKTTLSARLDWSTLEKLTINKWLNAV